MDLVLHRFLTGIKRTSSPKQSIGFLKAVLTPKEFVQIPKRLEILKLLLLGNKQRDISRNLKVAIGTVTRGSIVLKNLEETKPDWWTMFKKSNRFPSSDPYANLL